MGMRGIIITALLVLTAVGSCKAGQYQLSSSGMVVRSDGVFIPADPRNNDYQSYQAWVKVGNTPDPASEPVAPIPQQISAMQAKVALSRAGLLASVQAWVGTQSAETQLIWSAAPTFSRNSGLIAAGAAALGLSSAQLDALFVAGAAINP